MKIRDSRPPKDSRTILTYIDNRYILYIDNLYMEVIYGVR
ncbi:hypothetical protein CLOSYM_00053 [[Clostridium] symbiosum ATCC 14940]|uniref:Uncharacterized protein n=1 Tax=[Clostridium] symbiosum ATCC 14940 TaxID=411472 RepID=A0ABC9U447_CLOSY|nr:hypothetical protein CLOSYM_00053 [[Clostridium] symbiosum ATCC 14940]